MPYAGITKSEFMAMCPGLEYQSQDYSCWAACMSVLMRLNGFYVSEQVIINEFPDFAAKDGINSSQWKRLIDKMNEKYFSTISFNHYVLVPSTGSPSSSSSSLVRYSIVRQMYYYERYELFIDFLHIFKGVMVFIEGHFVVLLGHDPADSTVTYYDPWDNTTPTVPKSVFKSFGGSGEAAGVKERRLILNAAEKWRTKSKRVVLS